MQALDQSKAIPIAKSDWTDAHLGIPRQDMKAKALLRWLSSESATSRCIKLKIWGEEPPLSYHVIATGVHPALVLPDSG